LDVFYNKQLVSFFGLWLSYGRFNIKFSSHGNNESSSEKKLFQISPTAETSAAVPETLTGYHHPVKFPVKYYSF
jgi:hypothetical protein